MSTSTITAGYPVHAVKTYRHWQNDQGAWMTDWTAHCGVSRSEGGQRAFGTAGSARRLEMCPQCFPGRQYNNVNYPYPVNESADAE